MANPDVTYNAMRNEGNPFIEAHNQNINDGTDTETEETPQNSGIMIHVVPETNRTRWNHIEDLDSFFSRMYYYHQKHGFYVMMLQELCELGQFIYVVMFITYFRHCINYSALFGEDLNLRNQTKIGLSDVIYSTDQCVQSFGGLTWISLLLATLFWMFRLLKFLYHFIQYWDIKMFFNTALKIDDNELDNLSWHEVQKKIREVQSEQQMCIHKEQLTELDIYHRILRFKNYMVAMMNKNLIPSKVILPILGECVCLSRGLRYNIELVLFRGPWSPFENNWHLREEFKKSNRRNDLANKLSTQIFWLALANLILFPIIFIWQLMYFFFNDAELIKREPGTLGTRCWSQYGRLYLRHFNELDHELDARLNRAYRPATKYMAAFSSPLLAVIAKNIAFICGGTLMVLLLLTVYDEDVIQVEHVLTIISILAAVVMIARTLIPDENLIWCPEQLMTAVLAHVHYLPVSWRGLSHTSRIRDQFGQFFQLKAIYLLIDLVSPITTPFILLFTFRPRALDIVDFFRNFTVAVVGVGDVCSFAQMDVRKHGNPDWQLTQSNEDERTDVPTRCDTNQYTQGEHGKTELSLVHFTVTNPQWKMPNEARQFVQGLKRHALHDLNRTRGFGVTQNTTTAMGQSLISVGSMGGEYSSIVQSILQTHNFAGSQIGSTLFNINSNPNPFQPNISSPPAPSTNVFHHSQTHSRHSFDFDRMLQQNLTDGSTNPLRSTLHDINEDDNDDDEPSNNVSTEDGGMSNVSQPQTQSVYKGRRGGLSRCEGPPEGSTDGLLHSIAGLPSNDIDPIELTTTDMCLSTLYLHEIHYRHIRRRGYRNEQCRQIWQKPHQQPDLDPIARSYAAPSTSSNLPSTSSNVAEKTPLLGPKKS